MGRMGLFASPPFFSDDDCFSSFIYPAELNWGKKGRQRGFHKVAKQV
jgi:hypothetical protein